MSILISIVVGVAFAALVTAVLTQRPSRDGVPGQLRFGVFMWSLGVACLAFALFCVGLYLVDDDEPIASLLLVLMMGGGAIYCLGEATFVKGRFDDKGIDFFTPWTGHKQERWKDLRSVQRNDVCQWYTLTFASGKRLRLSPYLAGHAAALDFAEAHLTGSGKANPRR